MAALALEAVDIASALIEGTSAISEGANIASGITSVTEAVAHTGQALNMAKIANAAKNTVSAITTGVSAYNAGKAVANKIASSADYSTHREGYISAVQPSVQFSRHGEFRTSKSSTPLPAGMILQPERIREQTRSPYGNHLDDLAERGLRAKKRI